MTRKRQGVATPCGMAILAMDDFRSPADCSICGAAILAAFHGRDAHETVHPRHLAGATLERVRCGLGTVLENDQKVVVAGTIIRRDGFHGPTVVEHIFKIFFARPVRLNYKCLLHRILLILVLPGNGPYNVPR